MKKDGEKLLDRAKQNGKNIRNKHSVAKDIIKMLVKEVNSN